MTNAYLREAVGVTVGRGGKFHLEREQTGLAMCSKRTLLDRASGTPTGQVAGVSSCMRPGCRQGWDAVDPVFTMVTSHTLSEG